MASIVSPESNIACSKERSSVRNLDTIAAYDLWSEVYDTDGNFLQALDTIEMQSLLPKMLSQIITPTPWKIIDLGCGTGRNTSALLHMPHATIIGLDASTKMLELAESKFVGLMKTFNGSLQGPSEPILRLYDLLADTSPPACALNADAVVSTLVMEHIPLPVFFGAVSQMLKPGGIALITNMHAEMGAISQAGFVAPLTGEKVRPRSYAHQLEDVFAEIKAQGFNIEGNVRERRVGKEMCNELGERAKKWIGVMVWFGFCIRKRR